MKVFVANMKHFYQCRNLWVWYLIFLLPFILMFPLMFHFELFPIFRSGPRILPTLRVASRILLIFFVPGLLVADVQRNILTKPFSFCLPGHKKVSKVLILGIGGAINLLFGMIFLGSPELEYPNILLTPLAVSFVGMIFYLLGVWLVLLSKKMSYMPIFPIIYFGMFFPPYILEFLEHTPLLPISAGALACGISWKWLGRESLAREYSGRMMVGMADGWNLARRRKYQQDKVARTASKRDSRFFIDRLEEFFLSRMKECSSLGWNRYVLGNLHILSGKIFRPRWMMHLFLLMGTVLLIGYFPDGGMSNYLFIMPVIYAFQLDLIPHRKLLVPGGRTERYYGALASGFMLTVLSTLLVVIVAVLSEPLGTVLPDITWKGSAYAFYPMDLREFYICLFLMPMALIAGTIFLNNYLARFAVLMVAGGVFGMWMASGGKTTVLSLLGLPAVVSLVAASWIGSVVILGYHCRKRSLVGQGK